jgi:RNA polymerase sigma factor (sigma-70 family)
MGAQITAPARPGFRAIPDSTRTKTREGTNPVDLRCDNHGVVIDRVHEGAGTEGDGALVRRARAGDRRAFGVLVDRHRGMVTGLCRRMVADRAAAADIIQEATLTAWLNLDYVRSPERFASWWCGIALNHARRFLARGIDDRVLLSGFAPERAADGASGPEIQVERADVSTRVRAAVEALPPSQRHATYRFYLQGLTYREAAEELGISVNALKARLHQGRRTLRRTLDEFGPKEDVMSVTEELVAVEIVDVRRGHDAQDRELPGAHIVLLKAKGSERYLTISIGAAEGNPLALSLEDYETPRPLTHQLTSRLVESCGGRIVGISITRLVDAVYYGTVTLETPAAGDNPAGTTAIDARPSDALNLAALTGAAITVEASMLHEADEEAMEAWRDLSGRETIVEEVRRHHDEALRFARRHSGSPDEP